MCFFMRVLLIMNVFLFPKLGQRRGSGGLADAAELLVRQGKVDELCQIAVLLAQHALALFYHELAAGPGHDAPEQQHMAEVVHIMIQSERMRQIYSDAAVYRGGAEVALFHEFLHDLELFGRGQAAVQRDARRRPRT